MMPNVGIRPVPLPSVVIAVSAWLLLGSSCGPVDQQLSLSFEGRTYSPSCAPVARFRLSEERLVTSPAYPARPILGIDVGEAFAADLGRHCPARPQWDLVYEEHLTEERLEEIEQQMAT
jgi:hypothetical protein